MNEPQIPDEQRLRAIFRGLAAQRADGFGLDLLTRLGDTVRYDDLDIEERDYEDVRSGWRPLERFGG